MIVNTLIVLFYISLSLLVLFGILFFMAIRRENKCNPLYPALDNYLYESRKEMAKAINNLNRPIGY